MKNTVKYILAIITFGLFITLAVLTCNNNSDEKDDTNKRLSIVQMAEKAKQVDGDWIYSYYENKVGECMLSIYTKNNQYFIKMVYPNGQSDIEEIVRTDKDDRIMFTYKKQGIYNGEYYEVYMGDLYLYNKEGKVFSIAKKYGE